MRPRRLFSGNGFAPRPANRRTSIEYLEERLTPVGPMPDLTLDYGGLVAPAPPGSIDVFAPTVIPATNVPAAAPDFGEWNRTASARQTLTITGAEFTLLTGATAGTDTKFWVYAQTTSGNGVLTQATLQFLEGGEGAVITMPGTLPANSLILLWAENGQGVSKPVAINQTETWWIGPDKAQAGQSIAIFGQNLSRTGGEWKTGDAGLAPASVWIEPTTGGSGQWVVVTAVNPYRVDFNLPANLAQGTYRAWIHNGRGGAYGWGKPLTFEVRSAAANVTSFAGPVIDASLARVVGGVTVQITPNDSTDDAAALQAAFDAAKVLNLGAGGPVYPTIVLPAGTYLVGTSLYLPSNVRLQGAGKDVTILKAVPSATFTNSLIFGGVQTNGVEIRDLTLHSGYDPLLVGANLYTGGISSVVRLDVRQDVRLTNVKIDARSGSAFYSSRTERLFLTNCDFISSGSFLDRNRGVFIDNCRFWETNNAAYAISNWGGEQLSITNCSAESESLADPSRDAGWGLRFFTSSRGGRFEYLARNTTRNLGNRPGVEGNVGEHILWETSNSFFVGSPVVVAGNQFVVSDLRDFPFGDGYEYNVVVVDGPGIGQTRQISAYDPATNMLTVAEPWGVPIATDSALSITRLAHHIVVYKNDVKGLAENVTRVAYNGSAGIVLFGAAANFVIDGNTVTDIRRPISIWAMSDTPGQSQLQDPRKPLKLVEASVFNLVVNNTVNNSREGIALYTTAGDELADNSPIGDYSPLVGNIIRGNTVRGSLTFGLGIGYLRSQSDWRSSMTVDLVVFEGNVVSNVPIGINVNVSLTGGETPATTEGPSVRTAIFVGNSFTRGTAISTGSQGVLTGGGQAPLLKNNAFNGFQTTYGGVFPVSASVIAGPTAKAREYSFTVVATDIFLDADNFNFDVDWNYDGVFDQSAASAGSSWTVARTFTVSEAPGPVPVRFRVTSPNNISVIVQLTIDPAQRSVYYLGSERADAAGIVESTNRTVIVGLLTMGGRSATTARAFGQVTGAVLANLGDGPDLLSAESLSTISVYAGGGSYSDTLIGGVAADSLDGGDGPDSLLGGNGNDTLVGGNHRDTLRGGKGDDLLNGSFGSDEYDYAFDDGGNDTILEPANMDNDWLDFSALNWAVTVTPTSVLAKDSANQTVLSISIAEPTAIESIIGTSFADSITGNARVNRIHGGEGNDTIFGGGDNDIVIGGGGNDSLDGGDGDDFLDGGLGADQIFGGLGNDTISGGDGDDQIQGQGGNDLIDGGEGNDVIRGGDGNDGIDGGGDNDQIDGGAGDDVLLGNTGADVITGGDGNDSMTGGAGNDTLTGGAGNDVYVFARSASLTKLGSDMVIEDPAATDVLDMLDFSAFSLGMDAVAVNLAASDGVILDLGDKLHIAVFAAYGLSGDASGIEGVVGTDRNDVLLGNNKNNLLFGGGGNDSLVGGDGRDILVGGDGADTLFGGNGEDILLAGTAYNWTTNPNAWLGMKAEWESARTFTTRVTNLRGTNPSTRLNGNYFLNSASLIDDALVDSVAGGANADWMLVDFLEDVIAGFDASDVLYNIRP